MSVSSCMCTKGTCSNPRVLYKEIDGERCEPMEHITLDVPNDYVGPVVEKLGQRKGDLIEMTPLGSGNRMRIEYKIPTRCLFGYRSEFLTATHGEGIMNTLFAGYEPYRGERHSRLALNEHLNPRNRRGREGACIA